MKEQKQLALNPGMIITKHSEKFKEIFLSIIKGNETATSVTKRVQTYIIDDLTEAGFTDKRDIVFGVFQVASLFMAQCHKGLIEQSKITKEI